MEDVVEGHGCAAHDEVCVGLREHHHYFARYHFGGDYAGFVDEDPVGMVASEFVAAAWEGDEFSAQLWPQPYDGVCCSGTLNHFSHERVGHDCAVAVVEHYHALTLRAADDEAFHFGPCEQEPQVFSAEDEALAPASSTRGNGFGAHVPEEFLMIRSLDEPLVSAHQYGEEDRVIYEFARHVWISEKLPQRFGLLS